MNPEFLSRIERPHQTWLDQETAILERATRLARNERLGQALHEAVLNATRRIVDGTPT